jgi:TolB-like protein
VKNAHDPAQRPTAIQGAAVTAPTDSIAVLPFADLSQEHDQEYFADGMAEEVLDLLTQVPGLKVIGRSSSFQFKGQNQDLRKIGDALGVRYVIEGSVRRSGQQVRVTAQLIDTADGSHLWSETYDEPTGNVLTVQDRIAAGLVRTLQLSIEAGDYSGGRRSFKNGQAYDFYLRGVHAWQSANKEGLEAAVAYLQRALDLEPSSVVAAELLAGVQESLAEFSYVAPAEGFERARSSAQHVLTLDSRSWEAHLILSDVHLVYDWDWTAAEQDAQKALSLQPHDSETLQGLARVYEALGRWDDGIHLTQVALALDPFDPSLHLLLGNLRAASGELGAAEAELRKMLQISPSWGEGHYDLAGVLLLEGKVQAALAEMQQEQTASSHYASLAMVYHAMGRHVDSNTALAAAQKGGAQDYASEIADACAYRGEADAAFNWLERAYRQKDTGLYLIKTDVFLARLKSNPRYAEFLRKMNLPK